MEITDILSCIGGIGLFLFGMSYMGEKLKKFAGNKMKVFLTKVTSNPLKGFLVGMIVTMAIQSSTATNVMVLSFVNTGMMALTQSIPLMIGANLGTTVTAWIISLSSIDGAGLLFTLIKPAAFTPILCIIGVILYKFVKNDKKRDIGAILIGFAILMFGMTMMSSSMSSLSEVPGFMALFDALSNPFLGILFGAAMAAIMQSSSSSVGVIQALAMAGGIAFNSVIPIIMGINVGQVVPVLLASMGTSKDARRAAVIDLYLNVAGIVVFLPVYMILKATGHFPFDAVLATPVTIAICHTGYKLLTSVVELPAYRFYEKLGRLTIKEGESQKNILLDERFMSTPSLALAQCRQRVGECIKATNDSYQETVTLLDAWDPEIARRAHRAEELADWYQDEIDAYLAKLSVRSMTERESLELSYLMHVIADYENITDHVYHIVVTLNRFWESGAVFNETAKSEMQQLTEMTRKILRLAEESFYESDSRLTFRVIAMDRRLMKACEKARESQMARLISGETSVEGGTAFTDLLLDFERISDHLSKQARLSLVEGSKKQGDDAKRFLSILLDQEADEEDKLKRDLAIKA